MSEATAKMCYWINNNVTNWTKDRIVTWYGLIALPNGWAFVEYKDGGAFVSKLDKCNARITRHYFDKLRSRQGH